MVIIMASPSMRLLLRLTEIRSSTFTTILILLLLPRENFRKDGNENELDYDLAVGGSEGPGNVKGRKSSMLVGAMEEAGFEEKKLKGLFISDIKKLLTHNQVFYNSYGHKDVEVDLAFEEAKLAADVIYLYPQIFHLKVQAINERIKEALKKGEKEKVTFEMATTADGVPVYFVDKGLILLGVMGGMIRFPE